MSGMTDETYQGSANRETWAFNLHWQNDRGLYNETLDEAREVLQRANIARHHDDGVSDYELGYYVTGYWRDLISDIGNEGGILPARLRMFRDEVGSWWRIDYAEVGAAVRESLDNES